MRCDRGVAKQVTRSRASRGWGGVQGEGRYIEGALLGAMGRWMDANAVLLVLLVYLVLLVPPC